MNKRLIIVDPQVDYIRDSLFIPDTKEAMNSLAGDICSLNTLKDGVIF